MGKSICLWVTLLPFNSYSCYFLNPKWFHMFPALAVLLHWTSGFICVCVPCRWVVSWKCIVRLKTAAVSTLTPAQSIAKFKEVLSVWLRGRKWYQIPSLIYSLTHWSNILCASYILGIMLGTPKWDNPAFALKECAVLYRDSHGTNIKI